MKIDILCSGITGKIYAVNTRGKLDVTQQVINAVMQHMDITKSEYECKAGDLIFKPKSTGPTESTKEKPVAE
jgi:hypothetical protein